MKIGPSFLKVSLNAELLKDRKEAAPKVVEHTHIPDVRSCISAGAPDTNSYHAPSNCSALVVVDDTLRVAR